MAFDPAELESRLAEARAAAAKSPIDRAALGELERIEGEMLRVFEHLLSRVEKDANGETTRAWFAKRDTCQKACEEMFRVSDEAVARFFTPEVIEATPWRDLLAEPDAWRCSELKGFRHDFVGGALDLVGPDGSERSEGLVSVGDREVWHDFEIEIEFTIVKGECSLYFRLPLVYQKNVEQEDLTTDEGEFEPGRSYILRFRVIGSSLTEENVSEPAVESSTKSISWTRVRKGAFGIALPTDSEVKITRLRARVLR